MNGNDTTIVPTTDEIRRCFDPSYCRRLDPSGRFDDKERDRMFDAWLAEHDRLTAERAQGGVEHDDERKKGKQ